MADKVNILVIGANGQLGREIRGLTDAMSDRYFFADVTQIPDGETLCLDVTDVEAVRKMVRELDIDVIINCAAYTDVERAEDEPESSALLNAVVPGHLACIMKESDGLLVHISTDYVFDGSRNVPYTEDVEVSPVSVYGRTKADGEKAVADSGCRHITIRTSWLYSGYGRNFVKTMLGLFASRPQVRVVSDQTGTPTYALDLAKAICGIIDGRKYPGNEGIYNFSGDGGCTWYDFAQEISRLSGNVTCEVCPCTTAEYPTKAARPAYSVLDKTRIVATFGVEVPCWKDSLQKCLANLKTI